MLGQGIKAAFIFVSSPGEQIYKNRFLTSAVNDWETCGQKGKGYQIAADISFLLRFKEGLQWITKNHVVVGNIRLIDISYFVCD